MKTEYIQQAFQFYGDIGNRVEALHNAHDQHDDTDFRDLGEYLIEIRASIGVLEKKIGLRQGRSIREETIPALVAELIFLSDVFEEYVEAEERSVDWYEMNNMKVPRRVRLDDFISKDYSY